MAKRFKDDERRFRDAVTPILLAGGEPNIDSLSAAAGLNPQVGKRIHQQVRHELKRKPVAGEAVELTATVAVSPNDNALTKGLRSARRKLKGFGASGPVEQTEEAEANPAIDAT